jgi:hypothetical protein
LNSNVDASKLTPASQIAGEDAEDTALLVAMREDAARYLKSFEWCTGITETWFGCGVGGVFAVFLVGITSDSDDADSTLWVVVGDLPPAYLVTDDAPTPTEALRCYVQEMRQWVNAVRENEPLDDVIPVNVVPTPENADKLDMRLSFLEREFLQPSTA